MGRSRRGAGPSTALPPQAAGSASRAPGGSGFAYARETFQQMVEDVLALARAAGATDAAVEVSEGSGLSVSVRKGEIQNVERTRDMFGQYAAQEVQKRLGKKDDWGTKKFTLSNGVKCNIPNRKCVKDEGEGERSKKITKHLFQAPAPQPR